MRFGQKVSRAAGRGLLRLLMEGTMEAEGVEEVEIEFEDRKREEEQ